MSLLSSFAESNRLKVHQRADGERVILGRDGEIYAYRDRLAVIFIPKKWTPRRWNGARIQCEILGMTCVQNGDSEGTLLFDPADKKQTQAAIKLAHVKTKREMSPAQAEAAARALAKAQEKRAEMRRTGTLET